MLGEELGVLRQPDVLAEMPLLILVVAVVHIAPAVEAAANLGTWCPVSGVQNLKIGP